MLFLIESIPDDNKFGIMHSFEAATDCREMLLQIILYLEDWSQFVNQLSGLKMHFYNPTFCILA